MHELPTAVRSGLFTVQDVPVPLAGVSIDCVISSFCGRVSVAQRFVNREANPDFTERASRPAATAPPPAMQALVALQAADGSWDLTRELADIIGRSLREIESALTGATGNPADARKAWATALALVWLRTKARLVEGEWSLLAAKARRWLDDTHAVPPGRGAWLDAAADFLRP